MRAGGQQSPGGSRGFLQLDVRVESSQSGHAAGAQRHVQHLAARTSAPARGAYRSSVEDPALPSSLQPADPQALLRRKSAAVVRRYIAQFCAGFVRYWCRR